MEHRKAHAIPLPALPGNTAALDGLCRPGDDPGTFGETVYTDADLLQLLRWASWVLSLPVMLLASGPFLGSAWRDLRQGRIGMDVPVSVGILITFGVSTLATFDPTGPWGQDIWLSLIHISE
ncbi:MAG: hypothetical protein N2690_10895, partial [Rhodocyclaceae bacterium]|nr:hypothetical protein [Rhodocyclaceae bacterium]